MMRLTRCQRPITDRPRQGARRGPTRQRGYQRARGRRTLRGRRRGPAQPGRVDPRWADQRRQPQAQAKGERDGSRDSRSIGRETGALSRSHDQPPHRDDDGFIVGNGRNQGLDMRRAALTIAPLRATRHDWREVMSRDYDDGHDHACD